MADKDKKKLKVILKLPKTTSAQQKSSSAAGGGGGGGAVIVAKSAPFAFSAPASQFSAGHDYRNRNVHNAPTHHHATTAGGGGGAVSSSPLSAAHAAHAPSYNTSVRSSTASRSVVAGSAAGGSLHGASSAARNAPTPPKKRKFKTVEQAGAGVGSVSAASVASTAPAAVFTVPQGRPAAAAAAPKGSPGLVREARGGGGGGQDAGVGTAVRSPIVPPSKKSHKKQVKPVVNPDGHAAHPFAGVFLPPQALKESLPKPMLEGVLDKLQKKDTYGVFAEPVDASQVPDYYDIISEPMDFGTMRKKINKGSYTSVEIFEGDIYLVCSNAMRYNGPETIYYKQARAIRDMARKALEGVRVQLAGDIHQPSQKKKLPPSKKTHPKRAASSKIRFDGMGSDYTFGATLAAAGEPKGWLNSTVDAGKAKKGLSMEKLVGANEDSEGAWANPPGGTESKVDAQEDASGAPAIAPAGPLKTMGPKDGRRPLSTDEYHRNTYKQRLLPAHGQVPPLAAIGGELRQLVAGGSQLEHAYAKSLLQFGSSLGPHAWRFVARKLQKVLAPNVPFGPGWVGEHEAPAVLPKPRLAEGHSHGQQAPGSTSANTTENHRTSVGGGVQLKIPSEIPKSPTLVRSSSVSAASLPSKSADQVMVDHFPTPGSQSAKVGAAFSPSKPPLGMSKSSSPPKPSPSQLSALQDATTRAMGNSASATAQAVSSTVPTPNAPVGAAQIVHSTASAVKSEQAAAPKVANYFPAMMHRRDGGIQPSTSNASLSGNLSATSVGQSGGSPYGYPAVVSQTGPSGGSTSRYLVGTTNPAAPGGMQHLSGVDKLPSYFTSQGHALGPSNQNSASVQGSGTATSNHAPRVVQGSGPATSKYSSGVAQGSGATSPSKYLPVAGPGGFITSYPMLGVQGHGSAVSNYPVGGAQGSGPVSSSSFHSGAVQGTGGFVSSYPTGGAQGSGSRAPNFASGGGQGSVFGALKYPSGTDQGSGAGNTHYPSGVVQGPVSNFPSSIVHGSSVSAGALSSYSGGQVSGGGNLSNYISGAKQDGSSAISADSSSGGNSGTSQVPSFASGGVQFGLGPVPSLQYSSGFAGSGPSGGLSFSYPIGVLPPGHRAGVMYNSGGGPGGSSANLSSGVAESRPSNHSNYVPGSVQSNPGALNYPCGVGQAGQVAGATLGFSNPSRLGSGSGGASIPSGDGVSSNSSRGSQFGQTAVPSSFTSVPSWSAASDQNSEKVLQGRSQYMGNLDLQGRGGRLEDITSGVVSHATGPKQGRGTDGGGVPDLGASFGRMWTNNPNASAKEQPSKGVAVNTGGKGYPPSWNPVAAMHGSAGYAYPPIPLAAGRDDVNAQAWAQAQVKSPSHHAEAKKLHTPSLQGFPAQSSQPHASHAQSFHQNSSHPQSPHRQSFHPQNSLLHSSHSQSTHPQSSHPQSSLQQNSHSQSSFPPTVHPQISTPHSLHNSHVQSSHPPNSQLSLSGNSTSILHPPLHAEYNNLVARPPAQQSTTMLMVSGSNSEAHSQQPDSFTAVSSGSEQMGTLNVNSQMNKRPLPSLQASTLKGRTMPPDLNVALISPSALQSPSAIVSPAAQQVSTPPGSQLPDLKLQL